MKKCKHCGRTYSDYRRTCPYCEESHKNEEDTSYCYSSSSSSSDSYSYGSGSSFDGGSSDGGGCSGDF